jgi:hypothetical protein
MNEEPCMQICAFEKAAAVEFRNLGESMREMKERIARLEQALGRGAALLLANLAGMVIMLAGRLIG